MTFRLSTRWANFLNSMLEPRDASLAKGAHWCLTPALCFLEAAGTPLPELSACPSPAAALHCSHIVSVRVAPVVQRLPYCSRHHLAAVVGKFDNVNKLPTAAAADGARRAPRER